MELFCENLTYRLQNLVFCRIMQTENEGSKAMENQSRPAIRLIAFDLDGTFLDREKKIPEENIRAIEQAAKKGIEIVPATGRLYAGLPEEIRALPFIRYFILVNGAKVYDAKEDKVLYAADLPNELALALFRHGDDLGCLYDCYLRDEGLMSRRMYDRLEDYVADKHYVKYMKAIRRPVDDLPSLIREDGGTVQKVQYFFRDNEKRLRQLASLPVEYPGVKATSSMPTNIEINAADASKGPALERLCLHLGFTAEQAAAFGDSTNDLDMLQKAGTGIAMRNSDKSLFEAADMITACDNNDAGVGKTIMELIG